MTTISNELSVLPAYTDEYFKYTLNIYIISCKDTDLCSDSYVGRTQDLFSRQDGHISSSKASGTKLYEKIRETGGWDNWKMSKISTIKCKNRTEAKQIEQYYCNLLKPTLNMIPAHKGEININMVQERINFCFNNKNILSDDKFEIYDTETSSYEYVNDKDLYKCDFCSNMFDTQNRLDAHKNSAAYCLKLQGKETEIPKKIKKIHKCFECNDEFATKQTLNTHFISCKIIKQKKITNKDDEIERLKKILEKIHIEKNIEKDVEIERLRNENKELRDNLDMNKINKQKCNSFKNKYVHLPTLNLTYEIIKEKIDKNFNETYIAQGQTGVATFVHSNLLLDSENKLKYVCGDSSRLMFYYKNQDETIEKDAKAFNLTNMIYEQILSKCNTILETTFINNIQIIEKVNDIKKMCENNNEFISKLSLLTDKKFSIKK
jgi:hypothetical protein